MTKRLDAPREMQSSQSVEPSRTTERGKSPQEAGHALDTLPVSAIALGLLAQAGPQGLIYVAADERRAEEIGRVLAVLAPELDTFVFPPWDCLPFDRAPPSRDAMGRRMAVLQRLAAPDRPRVLISSVDAVLQRIPPPARISDLHFVIDDGGRFDIEDLRHFAMRVGYAPAERVEEPGDYEVHGQVVEIFPPGAPEPVRIEMDGGRAIEIHTFDPVSQRSTARKIRVSIGPASEFIAAGEGTTTQVTVSAQRDLSGFYGEALPSIFDLMPEAIIIAAPGTEERRAAFFEQLDEAHAAYRAFGGTAVEGRRPLPDWNLLYTDEESWRALLGRHEQRSLASAGMAPVPAFTEAAKPVHAFQIYLEQALKDGQRIVLAGVARDLTAFARHLERHGGSVPEPVSDWTAVTKAKAGAFLSLELDLDEGIVDEARNIALFAAADILGTHAHHDAGTAAGSHALLAAPPMRIGDTVIHEDHGIGILRGIEAVDVGGKPRDAVRLEYHEQGSLLVPVEDLDRLWRYGSDEEAVSLDRLHTKAWFKRRIDIEKAVLATARHLVAMAEERRTKSAPKLTAPTKPYARFTARFAYPLTRDQARAVAAVTEDLASGHPMDRLVCGDVGFGKTEVALRAAAIALMAGKQVALVAPTTVLARQHLETFRKRFAGFGFEIAGLSRLESSVEARRVKAGLADGTVHMVVGTHAVGSANVVFADLGLLVVDEEQKFGARLKSGLRTLADGGHVLTLTATPIPRTLQMALVGVQTVSVIATPPVRRRPIRTLVTSYDPAAKRVALLRERARGGQSFVIAPRISDIARIRQRLADVVPELEVLIAHGDLPAEEVDAAMVGFAQGRGDVLLATNIVESGLDVPRANTILVWNAGHFGLSQLHQLRGRVGRGRAQGVAYLLTDPDGSTTDSTAARLAVLQSLDRLGAGFAISARDLDLRGAGDIIGEEQAGHMRLIGLELYQSLLARAVTIAKGERVDDEAPPDLILDQSGRIPEHYVAEADLRIELYGRLSRLKTGKAIRAFHAEMHDRFGKPPLTVDTLFSVARIRNACRGLGVASLSAGPRGVSLIAHPAALPACSRLAAAHPEVELKGAKLVLHSQATDGIDPLDRAEALIDLVESVA